MMYLGKDAVSFNMNNMKLINKHIITQDYTKTLSTLYTNEIAPYITFGDYTKLCVVIFKNNTTELSNSIDCIFFSLCVDITTVSSSQKNGGMIRSGYTNFRDFQLSNDARCASGTTIYIYELNLQ